MMRFAGDYVVPMWLAVVYLGSNVVLNTLNFYWFGKMIETIKKRFTEVKGAKGGREKEEGVLVEGLMDSSTLITEVEEDGGVGVQGERGELPEDKGWIEKAVVDGRSVVEVESTEVRRRRD